MSWGHPTNLEYHSPTPTAGRCIGVVRLVGRQTGFWLLHPVSDRFTNRGD